MTASRDRAAVWVFFYGSYINLEVLAEVAYVPERRHVARLAGFDLRIEPRANLVASERDTVYGIVATATHAELARLYHHAEHVLGEVYLPRAVLAETIGGELRPALCYVCHDMTPRSATDDYIERIVGPAREYGFPEWYIDTIERFRKVPR